MATSCIRCGEPLESLAHLCTAWAYVIDPGLLRKTLQEVNPLDRLTVGEKNEIYGVDEEEDRREAEADLARLHQEYLDGPLAYRVELLTVTGLGFQDSFDFKGIQTEGHTDADLGKVLEFLNSESYSPIHLSQEEVYLCRLVSFVKGGGIVDHCGGRKVYHLA